MCFNKDILEELVTTTDSVNTLEFKNEFIVFPNLPNLGMEISDYRKKNSYYKSGKYCNEKFSYNSFTNNKYLTIKDLKKLIADYKNNSKII